MNDVCDTPVARGPNKGKPARGTWSGYQRHRRRGEEACADCRERVNVDTRKSKRKARQKKPKGQPLTTGKPSSVRTEPVFVGSRSVRCRGCGTRGSVNRRLVGLRQYVVEECVNCR